MAEPSVPAQSPHHKRKPSPRAPRPGRQSGCALAAARSSVGVPRGLRHRPAVRSPLPQRLALQLLLRAAVVAALRVCPPPEAGTVVGGLPRPALVAANTEDAGPPPRVRPCARYLALENPERQEWGPSLWSDENPRVGPAESWGQSCAPRGRSREPRPPWHRGLAVWVPASREEGIRPRRGPARLLERRHRGPESDESWTVVAWGRAAPRGSHSSGTSVAPTQRTAAHTRSQRPQGCA